MHSSGISDGLGGGTTAPTTTDPLAALEIEMRMLDFILNRAFEIVRPPISTKNLEAGELGLVIG